MGNSWERSPTNDFITHYQVIRLNYLAKQLRIFFAEDFVLQYSRGFADAYILQLEQDIERSDLGWVPAELGQVRLRAEESIVRPTFIARIRRCFAPLFR